MTPELQAYYDTLILGAGSTTPCALASFSFGGCVMVAFVPDSTRAGQSFATFKDGFLSRAPWGYFTHFVTIVASSTPPNKPYEKK